MLDTATEVPQNWSASSFSGNLDMGTTPLEDLEILDQVANDVVRQNKDLPVEITDRCGWRNSVGISGYAAVSVSIIL